MWFDNRAIQQQLWPATLETLYTTFWATLFTVIFGLLVGVAAVLTSPGGLAPSAWLHRVLGVIINVGRSIPYIILAFLLMNVTRFVVGSYIGWKAAVFTLTIAAIPFFARLVETAVFSVEQGKIEAAQMMGASRFQVLGGVLVREALPALVQSITVLVITLISYSAMAGAIGGGGLGALAINHGYNRFQGDVMVLTVVVIVILVQAIQMMGDMLSRLVDHR